MAKRFGDRFWHNTDRRRTDKLNPEKEKLYKLSDADQGAKLGKDKEEAADKKDNS